MFNHTHYFLEKMADEKIVDARRAAAHDRLALTAGDARREIGRAAPSSLAGLVRALANVLRRGRRVLQSTVPANHVQ